MASYKPATEYMWWNLIWSLTGRSVVPSPFYRWGNRGPGRLGFLRSPTVTGVPTYSARLWTHPLLPTTMLFLYLGRMNWRTHPCSVVRNHRGPISLFSESTSSSSRQWLLVAVEPQNSFGVTQEIGTFPLDLISWLAREVKSNFIPWFFFPFLCFFLTWSFSWSTKSWQLERVLSHSPLAGSWKCRDRDGCWT